MADHRQGARSNGTSNPWGSPATGDELELALRAAEQMLVVADERHRHAQNRSAAAISILISMAVVTAGTSYSIGSFGGGFIIGAVLTLFVATLVSSLTLAAWARDRRRGLADNTLQLATEIATLVGDVMADIARREGWSYLRRESTMLRLSAFPLLSDLEATRNRSRFRVMNGNYE